MSLEKRITTDLKNAMKAKDQKALRGIRAIKAAILLVKTDASGKAFDEAAEISLAEDLSRPISDNIRWKSRYQNDPRLKQLAQRPEIAARLNELDVELASLQGEVRELLLSPEWAE